MADVTHETEAVPARRAPALSYFFPAHNEAANIEALVAEAQRFTGAELVYTNLDPSTMDRIKGALGDTSPD